MRSMIVVLAAALLLSGCGARTEPRTDTSALVEEQEGGWGDAGPGGNVCKHCTTQVPECTYCMLQGPDAWVCAQGHPAPLSGCTHLLEAYTSNGWKFTCFYCD
jgi:hypothetical protein